MRHLPRLVEHLQVGVIAALRLAGVGKLDDEIDVRAIVIAFAIGHRVAGVEDPRELTLIEGDGAGWFGARLGDCNSARVRNNTAADLFFGFFVSGGLGNHTCANHMRECGIGITATAENHLDIDNNELVACAFTGIMAYVTATARISGNRLLNCGYSDTSSLGIAVFANQLYSESESMVRIEGNEVLDTGVNPVTNKASAAVSVGIAAVCAS